MWERRHVGDEGRAVLWVEKKRYHACTVEILLHPCHPTRLSRMPLPDPYDSGAKCRVARIHTVSRTHTRKPILALPSSCRMVEENRARHIVMPVVALGFVCALAIIRWMPAMPVTEKGKQSIAQLSRLGLRRASLTAAERKLVIHVVDPRKVQQVVEGDIIGQNEVIKQLRKTIRISLRGAGRGSVLSQGRGILLSGPPGTGKTTLAEVWRLCVACACSMQRERHWARSRASSAALN